MLRPSANCITLYLSPRQISGRIHTGLGLWRHARTGIQEYTVNESSDLVTTAENQLSRFLEGLELPTGQLRLLLSSHYIRHLWLPQPSLALRKHEHEAWLRYQFQQMYGDLVSKWEYRYIRRGHGIFASAIAPAFLTAIQNITTTQKMRLVSVQPVLTALCNHHYKRLKHASGWLVVVEHDRLSALLIRHGTVCGFSNEHLLIGDPLHLNDWLLRECATWRVESGSDVFLHATPSLAIKESDLPGFRLHKLSGLLGNEWQ